MRLLSALFIHHLTAGALLLLLMPTITLAQEADQPEAKAPEYSEEEQRQIDLAERFLSILQRNPREGTALDRVYGHHLEFGTLDQFVASLEADLKKDDKNGAIWMVLGMVQARRGEDGAAIEAYQKAETLRADDPIPAYYLGQTLLRMGKRDDAVAAMERSLERDPARKDELEIFQQLGRIHQRAQRTDEALKVWKRLEELYPDDTRVLEQIAITLAEEGEPELALERYNRLTQLERDDYRRTMYRVKVAELTIKTRDRQSGVAAFEAILGDLNPEGWIYRDVRRRIETVFLQSGDQDSLVEYYETWLEKNPEDVEGMVRLAQFLASTARMPEARKWMDKAVTLAPSRGDLRKAYIRMLVDNQQFTEAAEQYRKLSESDPDDPDILMEWGKLVLRDNALPLEQRKTEAERIWRLIIKNQADDPLTHAQVADAFRHAEMKDQALELYLKAVELAPGDPQYREYLGEFYHILKQPEKAKETWLAISAPPNRTADNLARTAEVFHGFGFLDDAIQAITEACEVDPKDFALHMKASDYQSQAKNYERSLELLDIAEGLATHDDQKDAVIGQRIEIYQSSDQLSQRTAEMAAEVKSKPDATADDWNLLARFHEAAREFEPAARAIEAALEIDPKSITSLTTAARIAESAGDFGRASEINRELADIDRRSRGDHLMNIVRLQLQMGQHDDALATAEELIRSAPGNTEHYQFYAQTCFRLGKTDEGLEALRKAVRINPNEPALIMALGSALSDQFKTREAIELYWRAFDKSEELDDKTTLVTKLVPLYDQLNEFDALIERLDTARRNEDQRRAMTICIAQAYQSLGDIGAARTELEGLLSENTRDTNLLQQLAKLCESASDMDAAIDYQQQLVAIAPGHETEFPLAVMLQSVGRSEEASQIYLRLTRREEDPKRLLTSLDSLLTQGNYESVVKITDPLLGQNQTNWEILYRNGVALASLEKHEEAEKRFRTLLELELPHDSLGVDAKERAEQERRRARSNNLQGRTTTVADQYSPYQLFGMAYPIRQETGYFANPQDAYVGGGSRARIWTPEVFGHARMAAYGWLLRFSRDNDRKAEEEGHSEEDLIAGLEGRATAEDASRSTIWDYLYVCNLRTDGAGIFKIAKRLASDGTAEAQSFFLGSLSMRHQTGEQNPNEAMAPQPSEPLSDDEIELMLKCYKELGEHEAPQIAAGSQIIYASNGQAYVRVGNSYQLLHGVYRNGQAFMTVVAAELRLANREKEADEIFEAGLAEAKSAQELMGTISLLESEDKYDRVKEFYDRWLVAAKEELQQNDPAQASGNAAGGHIASTAVYPLIQWIGRLAPDKKHEEIKDILLSFVDLSTIELRQIRDQAAKKPGRRVATNQPAQRRIGVQTYYGPNANYVQVEVLFDDRMLPTTTVQMLRQCFEVFKQNGEDKALAKLLEDHLDDLEKELLPFQQLMLAQVLVWSGEGDEVLPLVTEAAAQFPEQGDFQLQIAQLHLSRENFDEAMKLVDAVESFDPGVLQQRELIALRAAERLGDFERARQAAETLFGMRLDSQTQIQLAQTMQRLGMNDLSDAILARAERTIGNDPQALASMMRMYQAQGKADQAKQAARLLLRRTTVPTLGSVRTATASRDAGVRSQAIKVLQQAGELDQMIEDLEGRIERSPNSPRFYQELAELFNATGSQSKVLPLLTKAVESQPKAVELRLQLAQALESTSKRSEACDQYLIVLKEQPQALMRDLSRVRNAFQSANRVDELGGILVEMDSRQISQPHYVLDIAQQILRKDADSEVGLKLLEKVFDDFPNYRSQLLSNATPQIFQNDRFFAMAKQSLVPSAAQIKADPWFGFHQIRSYSSDGTVHSSTSQMLAGLKGSPKLVVIEELIKESLKKNSDWHGGKAMLAQVELLRGNKDAARKQLKELLDEEEIRANMSTTAGWLLGQLAFDVGEMGDTTIELYELANDKSTNSGSITSQMRYSPVARLINLYKEADRVEDAKDLIMSAVDNVDTRINNAAYISDAKVQNYLWGAERLQELNCPVDAMRLYQKLLANREEFANAAVYRGRQGDYYDQQAKKGIEKAIELLTKSDMQFDPNLLLTADPTDSPEVPALDLMLVVPTPDKLGSQPISSTLADLVLKLSNKDELTIAFENRLIQLRKERPDDLSIPVLLLILQKKNERPGLDETIEQLVAIVKANPLETPEQDERPSSSQRRIAACSLPLWLAAEQIEDDQRWQESGKLFAERAIEAARLQADDTTTVMALLYAYGDHVLKLKGKEGAESKWSELLTLVTKRPDSSRRQTGEKTLLPPLVMSQFQTAMAVAKRAAENDMPQLSRDAFLESLKAGLPVSDPPNTTSTSGAPLGFVAAPAVLRTSSSSVARSTSQAELILQAISAKAIEVVQLWKGTDYPAELTYEVLRNVVLPESRPNECFLYPLARKSNETKVESLADYLIRAAKAAGKLDELKADVESRKEKSTNTLSLEILLGKLAMAQSDFPAANQCLVEIASQLITATKSDSIELACHIALPALEQDKLSENAFTIIKLAAKASQENTSTNLGTYVADKLTELVCEYAMKHGNPEAVREHFDNLIVARQTAYSRYGGDYGLYMQRQDLVNFANQSARIGAGDLALDFMGRAYDFKITNYGTPSFEESLTSSINYTRSLTPEKRYQAWATWTLPTPERKSLRCILQTIQPFAAPEAFVTKSFDIEPLHHSGALSNLNELVAAAKSANRLETLTHDVKALVDQDIPGASHLYALCLIEGDDPSTAEAYLASYFKGLGAQWSEPESKRDPNLINSAMVFFASLDADLFFTGPTERFVRFRDVMRKHASGQVVPVTIAYLHKLAVERPSAIVTGAGKTFGHWTHATMQLPLIQYSDQATWAKMDQSVVQLNGPAQSWLQLDYPIQGDFTFSFDAFHGSGQVGGIGYGGATVNSLSSSGGTFVIYTSGAELLQRNSANVQGTPSYERFTIQRKEDTFQCLLNGYTVYEEKTLDTSPWLMLVTSGGHGTSFRNFHMSGNPVVPKEVRLIAGNRMDGWNTQLYSESQPRRHLMAEPAPSRNSSLARQQQQEPKEFDWKVEEGVLLGRPLPGQSDAESWAFYQRPLLEGDSLRYEFYYEPGKTLVSPTLGRIALTLTPKGVLSHWLTNADDRHWVDAQNRVKEDAYRQTDTIALKENDWNTAELQLSGGDLIVKINDQPVYQRPVAQFVDTRFGIYRTKDFAGQVRNVTLRGDWPTDIQQIFNQDPLATSKPLTSADRLMVEALMTPEMQRALVREVMAKVKPLDDQAAYDFLTGWVLPNDQHQQWRLYFDYPPESNTDRISLDDYILCPAVELVRRAASLSQLAQLKTQVEQLETVDDVAARGKHVLIALIALESGDWDTAEKQYEKLLTNLQTPLPQDLVVAQRMPELLLAIQLGKHDQVWQLGMSLARTLRDQERDGEKSSGDSDWRSLVEAAYGAIEYEHLGKEVQQSDQRLTQWTEVPYVAANIRGKGDHFTQWIYERGLLSQIPADAWNQLFFQSPLTGKYEILAERSVLGHREGVISVGRRAAEPRYDLKKVRVITVGHGQTDVGSELEIANWKGMADFRIVVDGNVVTTYTNGVKIHEDKLPATPDPWVVLQSHLPRNRFSVHNLRIVGEPTIPSEIDLIESSNWWAWRADYYGDWHSQDQNSNAPYVKRDGEIFGNLRKDRSSSPLESLMMYTRPLLEDGEIEFESFYEPGQFEVHPAVGRTAYLLEEEGVATHQLTDAQWETRGLAIDNRQPLGDKDPDFVLNGWNKIRVAVQGDKLTIQVNGKEVVQQELQIPRNERFFGLFRYSDKTQCRVRNLKYRGDWPKKLPKLEDQQLAYASEGALTQIEPIGQATELKLGQSIDALKQEGLNVLGPEEMFSVEDDKLAWKLSQGGTWGRWPGVEKTVSLTGDTEITLDFHDLKLKNPKEGWGCNLSLVIHLDDAAKTTIDNLVGVTAKGEAVNAASVRCNFPGKEGATIQFEAIPENAPSGKLRLVRRGGRVHCLSSWGDDQPYQLIASFTVGEAKIRKISVRAKASDDNAEVSCAIGSMVIQELKPALSTK
ncbi:DUF1583 domain-containing protein [Blastopirellula marina]|nr:DUF1583 domain-containing protein [Blastopirellula marina]